MKLELWQALIAGCVPLLLAAAVALPKIVTARAANRKTDAETLATSYALVIDQLKEQVGWQGGEVKALRDQVTELMKMVNARDEKIGALQAENTALRSRLDQLEAQQGRRRRTDPPPPSPPPLQAA